MMTGGAAVGVQGAEQRRKDAALRGTGADGLGARDMFPQLHVLLPVIQKASDPAARWSQSGSPERAFPGA